MTFSISEFTSIFRQSEYAQSLHGINRGIERETLRVQKDGKLSTQPHNMALGSALTNGLITTDYSESLLEFITPVSASIDDSLTQLKDIQKFTLEHVNGDLFWPLSMPCVVEAEDDIKLAQYGSSNVGKMKTVYRQGLKNRYGSLMQVISGIHFNFSFPQQFFKDLQQIEQDEGDIQTFISERYFALIRNYKKFGWLIPYLFGSSPAICSSFLQGKEHKFPFKKAESGCLYLEYATSLRMSDLGYTNSAQSSLNICYNNLESYVAGVKEAINLPSDEFAKIGVKVDGQYQQLNSNILQIENELYAPIRPKRVAKSGQKPSDALRSGGVEYVEVRAMDVNPFVSTGISKQQMLFLDILLTYCVLKDSPQLTKEQYKEFSNNTNDVVLRGRDPKLRLSDNGTLRSISDWGKEIFAELAELAQLFDEQLATTEYSQAVQVELAKIEDVNKTPSAQILDEMFTQNKGIKDWSLAYSEQYAKELQEHQYQIFTKDHLNKLAEQSLTEQTAIEAADELDFDSFLKAYFES